MTLPAIPAAPALRADDSIAAVSVTELFTIGIGPSSSHTVGPMRAAKAFAREMLDTGLIPDRVQAELFGSLSLTGRGHHSDRAVLLGFIVGVLLGSLAVLVRSFIKRTWGA